MKARPRAHFRLRTRTACFVALGLASAFIGYRAIRHSEVVASPFCTVCGKWDFVFSDAVGIKIRNGDGTKEVSHYPRGVGGLVTKRPIGVSEDGTYLVLALLEDGEQSVELLGLHRGTSVVHPMKKRRVSNAMYCTSSGTLFAWDNAGPEFRPKADSRLSVVFATGEVAEVPFPEDSSVGLPISAFGCDRNGALLVEYGGGSWVIGDVEEPKWRRVSGETVSQSYAGWMWLHTGVSARSVPWLRNTQDQSWICLNAHDNIALRKRSDGPGLFSLLRRDSVYIVTDDSDEFEVGDVRMISDGPKGVMAVQGGLAKRLRERISEKSR